MAKRNLRKTGQKAKKKGKKTSTQSKKKKSLIRLNPKKVHSSTKRKSRTPRKRIFYTLKDDAKIITALQKKRKEQTKSEIAKNMAKTLGRSSESVRDRIKTYLGKMNHED